MQRDSTAKTARLGRVALVVLSAAVVVGGLAFGIWRSRGGKPVEEASTGASPNSGRVRFSAFGRFGFWLGDIPASTRARFADTGTYSNIEPEDYTTTGASECARCHAKEFQAWSQHSHRWMNAAATPDHVKGDFHDGARFQYLGGEGRFRKDGNQFFMTVERGSLRRDFRITRTIGSRYFEYYVGVQTAGPEPADDPRYRVEHVMPFGYWLTKKEWVPTVHIREDRADDYDDPRLNPYEDFYFRAYDDICARCHTTLPIGDSLIRSADDAGTYSPYRFSLDLSGYLDRQRPGLLADAKTIPTETAQQIVGDLMNNQPPARILHLGIVCEACHNGCKQHAADAEHVAPHFFPTSPAVLAELPKENPHGRTKANVNWICARCHVGPRPQFPGGMSTWNSAEYSDASRGACYSQLRCVDCHEPHRSIGKVWAHTPEHDDNLCLRCHEKLRPTEARKAHTHHTAGTAGDRCMNCHMPHVNEGLDTVVRTHTISSPTNPVIIENNGPNACNLCHLDRSIDWTVTTLHAWYGKSYRISEMARHYPARTEAVGLGWLKHPFRATRMVAAAAYARQGKRENLADVVSILDDRYLLNRQFGELAIESLTGQPLTRWGYHFTLSPAERSSTLVRIRQALVPSTSTAQAESAR